MRIAAVARALPEHHYDQETLGRYLGAVWADDPTATARLTDLHRKCGVARRHLALPLQDYAGLDGFTATNDAWIRCARDLGTAAVAAALERASLAAADVDAIFFTTVTGVSSPSIDALLMNRLPFRSDVRRVPMFGLGCVAGAAGLSRAADFVRAFPQGVALVLAVELCSLTLQRQDRSLANLIAAGLFGDGAAAAVVVGAQHRARGDGPTIVATRSVFYPDTEDVMGWRVGSHGFRLVLSAAVPAVARERLPQDVDAFLADHGLGRPDIASWVCHPGGPRVLRAVQDGLGLERHALRFGWDSLQQVGNLSSASVLLVLEDTMTRGRPAAGNHGVMLALGPGFCSELLLLRW